MIRPPALRPGGRVAVVAPSGPVDRRAFERGVAVLRERYDVRFDRGLFSRRGFFAGSDERRLGELQAALDDRRVRCVWIARGGHGLLRIAGRLRLSGARRTPKVVVGYSDVTVLHALLGRAGLASVHGPDVQGVGRLAERERRTLFGLLEQGRAPRSKKRLAVWSGGRAEGRLYGGTLVLLAHLHGLGWLPPAAGAIWFLEDVNEAPYRVDRLLTQLRIGGALRGLAGVLVGDFVGSEPDPRNRVRVESVLREHLGALGVPVLAGYPAGHGRANLPLPFGTRVRLDGKRRAVTFLESAVVLSSRSPS